MALWEEQTGRANASMIGRSRSATSGYGAVGSRKTYFAGEGEGRATDADPVSRPQEILENPSASPHLPSMSNSSVHLAKDHGRSNMTILNHASNHLPNAVSPALTVSSTETFEMRWLLSKDYQ